MPFRILVGLPSFNEADTIATVTADIDAALNTLPFRADTVLVNADNASTDGTPEVFLNTPTAAPKKVITTEHAAGKGTNTLALLRLAREQGVHAVVSVDTDLAEVPASWIHSMLGAVRDGVDFCYPLRPPRWNGGDLTYQLAYPVLAGLFGADLREPLCGDIALSRHAAERLLSEPWTAGERRYGGDFLIASLAVAHSWTTVTLGHKRRNKLRSFFAAPSGDYRMGCKFAENARAVQRRAAHRL
ncbi:MAG: glycosyltransferase family 2 protein, partial [Stackebrandtia sp.]